MQTLQVRCSLSRAFSTSRSCSIGSDTFTALLLVDMEAAGVAAAAGLLGTASALLGWTGVVGWLLLEEDADGTVREFDAELLRGLRWTFGGREAKVS